MDGPMEEIKSGILFKKDSKGTKWKEFFFVITEKHLYWYKTSEEKKEPKKRSRPKGRVILAGASVRAAEQPERPFTFHIIPNTKATELVLISCKDEEEMTDWINVLQSQATGGKDSKETVLIQEELRKIGHEIPASDLEFDDEVIGTGASGIVKRGVWLKSTEVAIKALKNVPEFTETGELLTFFKEIATLSKLRHINIVQMYGFSKKNHFICLVTEYVRGGNLAGCLADPVNYPMDLALQIELALNIARGMVYLHNQNIIHRDLKPANILIESWADGRVKVCDFGLSMAKRKEGNEQSEALGSPQYAAPELRSPNHNERVDVFSFAIILWEIATRKQPWPELKFGSQFYDNYSAGKRPALPSHYFSDLISRCWAQDPNARPSFNSIYETLDNLKKTKVGDSRFAQRTISSGGFVSPPPRSPGVPLPGMSSVKRPLPQRPTSPVARGGGGSEVEVGKAFGANKKITWLKFSGILGSVLGASPTSIQKLKYIFENGGMVEKSTWDQFILWFSPLAKPNLYQTNDVPSQGYDIDTIIEICTPSWFHAFLSSHDAQVSLRGKPDGTFLFRFSTSSPGYYALSASYNGTVGHWRISCSKVDGKPPIFKIDGREYKSLNDIITTHRFGRDPLMVKQPRQGEPGTCFLGAPYCREIQEEQESFYLNTGFQK